MSSLSRRDAALPRGRPSVVPIPKAHLPGPTWERGVFYAIGGRPCQWLAERWLTKDTWACVTPSSPDPERPGYSTSTRLIDWSTNTIIPEVGKQLLTRTLRVLRYHDYERVTSGLSATFAPQHETARPTSTWCYAYEIAGAMHTLVGERWRGEDRHASLSDCFPDSQLPGIWLTTRMLDPKGDVIIPVSLETFASLLPPPPSPQLRLARPCDP